MLKPWLLMTTKEKKEREQLYLRCTSSSGPIDEGLLATLRPPETKLQAQFELFIYQLRQGEKDNQC